LEEDRVQKQASSDAEEAAHDAGQQRSHREDVCRQRIELALCRDHLHHSSSSTVRRLSCLRRNDKLQLHWCLAGFVGSMEYLAVLLSLRFSFLMPNARCESHGDRDLGHGD
jgi:hypothetical protein